MGITAIKHITNNSSHAVFIHNHENPSNSVTISPNTTATFDIWIPWCTNQGDWQGNHYLSVEQPDIPRTLCWIWQQDNFVRYSTDGQFHDQGTSVPGEAQIDADRLLTINTDDSFIFMPDLILPGDYRALAGTLLQVLMGWYNNATGLWDTTGWWNSANALETMIDYAILTGSNAYNATIGHTFETARHGNIFLGTQDNFLNDFYDDEGWWALAWIKGYDLTGVSDYLQMAQSIFADMANGWSMSICNGGLPWRKSIPASKGSIQNELFLTVAARLYQRTSDAAYLTWATNEWQWFSQTGLIGTRNDPTCNMVLNLINNGLSNCTNAHDTIWTYNQGVIIGGLTDLYKGTGDTSKLQQAHAIAHAVITSNPISSLVDGNGILRETCEGSSGGCDSDQTQFKGIFIRNLAYLQQTDPRDEYRTFILRNADSIVFNNRTNANQCGLHWAGPFDSADASRQSSALDALNAALPFAWSAAFVSQSVPPSLTVDHFTPVTVTMKNTGTTTWSASEITPPVRLGAQNPQDNTTWGSGREDVPFPVAPGMTIPFNFSIRSPLTDGNYAFQWRMVQETVTWFGDFTPTVMISVTGTKGKEKEKEKDHKEKERKEKDKDRDSYRSPEQSSPLLPSVEDTQSGAGGQAFIQPEERPNVGDQALSEKEEEG